MLLHSNIQSDGLRYDNHLLQTELTVAVYNDELVMADRRNERERERERSSDRSKLNCVIWMVWLELRMACTEIPVSCF